MNRFRLIAILFAALMPAAGWCGMIEVRPTTLAIDPDRRIALLSLQNPEDHDATFQLSLYRWQQNGTEQALSPAPELIASPPIVTLPAHQVQSVRIGLRGALPEREAAYRVILEEVPSSNLPQRQGLNIALRVSLPLFVRPQSDPPAPALDAAAVSDGTHAGVAISNRGETTVRVTRVSAPDDTGTSGGSLAYIMPGHSARFAMAAAPPGRVRVQTDQGDIEVPVQSAMPAQPGTDDDHARPAAP